MRHLNTVKPAVGYLIMLMFVYALPALGAEEKKETEPMTVTKGKKVSIEYTLTLENKEVADTNAGKDPLTFEQGAHQIIPGLENALEGMKIGESRKVTVKPEDAYGAVVKEAIIEVGKDRMPENAFKVGAQVQAAGPGNQQLIGLVTAIKDEKATVDFNHPMAGKTLFFDVKVVDIK